MVLCRRFTLGCVDFRFGGAELFLGFSKILGIRAKSVKPTF